MTRTIERLRIPILLAVLALAVTADSPIAQSGAKKLPDAVTADSKHYTVEFENDVVRLLRVRLPAGERAPAHSHSAYCAIELTDSSLREDNGPTSESKAGQVFCGDATSHGPQNVGKTVAESIVVEFKARQRAR
jgi:quercetin dioxygenase-like cupin family protein